MHDPDMGTWAYTYNPDGLAQENRFTQGKGFTFQLSDADRRQAKDASGPLNAQALNRYSYVLNNPVRYIDPTGHNLCGLNGQVGCGYVQNDNSSVVYVTGDVCDDAECTTYHEERRALMPGQNSDEIGFKDADFVELTPGDNFVNSGYYCDSGGYCGGNGPVYYGSSYRLKVGAGRTTLYDSSLGGIGYRCWFNCTIEKIDPNKHPIQYPEGPTYRIASRHDFGLLEFK